MYAHKIKGLNMDWNERWWIWTGNWWEWLHMDRVDIKISRSDLNYSGTGWEWAEHEWERVKNEWKWVGPPFSITLYLASCNANMKKKFLEKSNFHCTLVFLLENIKSSFSLLWFLTWNFGRISFFYKTKGALGWRATFSAN